MKSGTKSPTKSPVKGGTKPQPGTRRAEKFQDGANKSGGIRTQHHAGPGRPSKTRPSGTKGAPNIAIVRDPLSHASMRAEPERCTAAKR
jgi:hypothetical protein